MDQNTNNDLGIQPSNTFSVNPEQVLDNQAVQQVPALQTVPVQPVQPPQVMQPVQPVPVTMAQPLQQQVVQPVQAPQVVQQPVQPQIVQQPLQQQVVAQNVNQQELMMQTQVLQSVQPVSVVPAQPVVNTMASTLKRFNKIEIEEEQVYKEKKEGKTEDTNNGKFPYMILVFIAIIIASYFLYQKYSVKPVGSEFEEPITTVAETTSGLSITSKTTTQSTTRTSKSTTMTTSSIPKTTTVVSPSTALNSSYNGLLSVGQWAYASLLIDNEYQKTPIRISNMYRGYKAKTFMKDYASKNKDFALQNLNDSNEYVVMEYQIDYTKAKVTATGFTAIKFTALGSPNELIYNNVVISERPVILKSELNPIGKITTVTVCYVMPKDFIRYTIVMGDYGDTAGYVAAYYRPK